MEKHISKCIDDDSLDFIRIFAEVSDEEGICSVSFSELEKEKRHNAGHVEECLRFLVDSGLVSIIPPDSFDIFRLNKSRKFRLKLNLGELAFCAIDISRVRICSRDIGYDRGYMYD